MRKAPSIASAVLLLIALLHAVTGVEWLLASRMLPAATQFATAGGLILAAAAATSRATLAVGLAIAAGASALRGLVLLDPPGPFAAVTLLLAAGYAGAAHGAWRLSHDGAPGWAPLALRGGLALAGLAYLVTAGLVATHGGTVGDVLAVAARGALALAAAALVDAPASTLGAKGKGLPEDGAMGGA